jgi:hypothetical protein
MSKTVQNSKFQELQGLDRISAVVHEMHCLFRETSRDDVGIDGEIEILAPKADGSGFVPTGGIVKVQSKSGSSYVIQDSPTSFATPIKLVDLEYFRSGNFPVLYVVYHPAEDKLYWKEVKSYIQHTPDVWQAPYRIVYDKTSDVLSAKSLNQIASHARIGLPPVSLQQRERLFTNLLPIKRVPMMLTCAPTHFDSATELNKAIEGFRPPFALLQGRLYTIADLRNPKCSLRQHCKTSQIQEILTKQWITDPEAFRLYVYMLNRLLKEHLWQCGVNYDRDHKRYYFRRQDEDSSEFRRAWLNVRTGKPAPQRITVKHYTYGRDTFWRHLAAGIEFKQFGPAWYLQVSPGYHITLDGRTPYPRERVGPLVTKIKSRERNPHVLNHVLFWTDVLARGNSSIILRLEDRPVLEIEKLVTSGEANFAILADPAFIEDPAEITSSQPDFLEAMFGAEDPDWDTAEEELDADQL